MILGKLALMGPILRALIITVLALVSALHFHGYG
jgi:hypothetical protein